MHIYILQIYVNYNLNYIKRIARVYKNYVTEISIVKAKNSLLIYQSNLSY